ncbi:MAG: pantetheine-phosphate adenylyltransferase [Gammaproteobacteria bacterium]|nr:pantetheine-phosphate adenylyltransferase [Gammaproteobacteria bacterium]NNC98450.1 pantetheine-phosphate adenylyltransferase [Gammaproteobacteria bacterium]NNM14757.1 pantetheine-phosphate adenylyltransferase [Gammaproteobacteria bacterium]
MGIRAMYPGTFDPITNGHIDLIERASGMFDEIVVAIADNPKKKPLFTQDERIASASEILAGLNNVKVLGYDNLTIHFAKQHNLNVIIRGIRAVSDYEFEFQLASMNRQLDENVETLFMTPADEYSYLSSSMVREIAAYGGDVSKFVHPLVAKAIKERFA